MIQFLADGDSFTEFGGYIKTVYRQIPDNEYNRIVQLSTKDRNREVEDSLDRAIVCGYGYYGSVLLSKDGKYYCGWKQGTSCD